MKTLALFDFDGTLTTKDTFLEFIKYYRGTFGFLVGFVICSPVLISYKLGIIPNWRAKEVIIKYFFGGEDLETFNQKGQIFCEEKVPQLIRPEAYQKLLYHKKEKHDVRVISASCENWVRSWCHKEGLKLIATKLEITEGKVSGKIDGKNCYGPEKTNRLNAELDLSEYNNIYAYGDSRGDREMLALANHKFYRRF